MDNLDPKQIPLWATQMIARDVIKKRVRGSHRVEKHPGKVYVQCAKCDEKVYIKDEHFNRERCPECGHGGG